MSAPPPPGYATVSPYLVTPEAERLMDFLRVVLDAQPLRPPLRHENGRIAHAELRIGDSVVMLGAPAEGSETVTAMLHVYVADVDAAHARALAQGAADVAPPEDKPDGDRRGGVRDQAGNLWYFATRRA